MRVLALAFIGSAAAFNPVMQMSTGRRAAIAGTGAAAVAAPLLRPTEADAAALPGKMKASPQVLSHSLPPPFPLVLSLSRVCALSLARSRSLTRSHTHSHSPYTLSPEPSSTLPPIGLLACLLADWLNRWAC